MVCLYYVDIVDTENCSSNKPVIDRTEKNKEWKKVRYAEMNTDGKNELLARRHATYQQKRSLAGKLFVIDDFFIGTCTLAYNHFIIHVIRAH